MLSELIAIRPDRRKPTSTGPLKNRRRPAEKAAKTIQPDAPSVRKTQTGPAPGTPIAATPPLQQTSEVREQQRPKTVPAGAQLKAKAFAEGRITSPAAIQRASATPGLTSSRPTIVAMTTIEPARRIKILPPAAPGPLPPLPTAIQTPTATATTISAPKEGAKPGATTIIVHLPTGEIFPVPFCPRARNRKY